MDLAMLRTKKSQGLPIYTVIVIIIGILVLAVVLLYIFGVSGHGKSASSIFFNVGGNVTKNASDTATAWAGG